MTRFFRGPLHQVSSTSFDSFWTRLIALTVL
jgi:hypothetical protein